jgi:retron-type reverse transcriptase
MCDEWLQNMDNGNLNCVVFLDVRKAFDSINHERLLQKMLDHFGIIGTELEWFKYYLTNREQQCTVNGQISSPKKTVCGIPQGSILGPLLFLLYINDMPKSLKFCTPSMYADDTEIYASAKDGDELVTNLILKMSVNGCYKISFKFIQQRQNICILDRLLILKQNCSEPNFN